MKRFVTILVCALLLAVIALAVCVSYQYKEKQRLKANQEALLSETEFYKTANGNYAASVQQLTLTKSELEQSNAFLTQSVYDLNVKLKRVQSVADVGTETKVEIQTVVKDSIVYVDRVPDTLQLFNWKDAWIDVLGTIHKKNVDLNITSRDTIVQVVHRIPKKFLFFRWGTKRIQQEMMSTNPHTKIVYSEFIKLN